MPYFYYTISYLGRVLLSVLGVSRDYPGALWGLVEISLSKKSKKLGQEDN